MPSNRLVLEKTFYPAHTVQKQTCKTMSQKAFEGELDRQTYFTSQTEHKYS